MRPWVPGVSTFQKLWLLIGVWRFTTQKAWATLLAFVPLQSSSWCGLWWLNVHQHTGQCMSGVNEITDNGNKRKISHTNHIHPSYPPVHTSTSYSWRHCLQPRDACWMSRSVSFIGKTSIHNNDCSYSCLCILQFVTKLFLTSENTKDSINFGILLWSLILFITVYCFVVLQSPCKVLPRCGVSCNK